MKKKEIKQIIKEEFDKTSINNIGDEFALVIKKELSNSDELKEAIDPISILSYLLASNTLINLLSKWVSKLAKKYNFEKTKLTADKIEHFTHHLEQDFKSPIKRVVKLFTKDNNITNKVTDGLFALLLLSLGLKAGSEAFVALKKSDILSGGVNTLKASLKGKDVMELIKNII